jgi:NAD(P)-dependent dehydrogenase (short-subunit alcohol dehydrogenase family)
MDLQLADKIALVTGASSGIGAATAQLLAAEGADVVVSYGKDDAGAQRSAAAVRACGRRAWLSAMDMADAASVARALEQVGREVAGLDVLILCAGQAGIVPFEELTAEEWQRVVQLNLNGTFNVLQAASRQLRDGASIVIVSSVSAHTGAPHQAHYAAAKAGLVNLAKSAARALAPRVRVNCVAPGMTLTPMGEETLTALPPDYAQKRMLVQRFATPDEIARAIVFVASPCAAFMSGATIDINGGRVLR